MTFYHIFGIIIVIILVHYTLGLPMRKPADTSYIGSRIEDLREVRHGDRVVITVNGNKHAIVADGTVDGFPWSAEGRGGSLDMISIIDQRPGRYKSSTPRDISLEGKSVHRVKG